jgi:hypothetical protein
VIASNDSKELILTATDGESLAHLVAPAQDRLRGVPSRPGLQSANSQPVSVDDQPPLASPNGPAVGGLGHPALADLKTETHVPPGLAESLSPTSLQTQPNSSPPAVAPTNHLSDAALANGPPSDSGGDPSPPIIGISAAQEESSMKKAQKMQKIAEVTEQNLPSHTALSARQDSSAASIEQSQTVIQQVPSGILNSDGRLDSIEKTHDLVALHALRLTHSNDQALKFVIEPGSGTRLSLEMRFKDGVVEAQALLHRGDYEFLNQHWADLQQRLEPRGIHLGALETSTHSSADDRQTRQQSRDAVDDTSTGVPFSATNHGRPQLAVTRLSQQYAGWQTWA